MSLPARTLGRRSVYLLPTREGLWFAATLLVLLLGAMNYNNGLAYAVTFLLASLATLSTMVGQRNLLGLTIHESLPRSAFAGSPVGFRVVLVNSEPKPRLGVVLKVHKGPILTLNLAPHEQRTIEIPWPTERRGQVAAPALRISSSYPFGLLRVFSRRLALEDAALAYPRPAAHAALPSGGTHGDADQDALDGGQDGGGDFVGLSPLRAGESPRHIHWKAVAAGRGLLVKRFAGLAEREIWLTLGSTGDIEERLSRLCRQALDAERESYRYGLVLGADRLPPNAGPLHLETCLRRLALYDGHD